jgi:fructokinase
VSHGAEPVDLRAENGFRKSYPVVDTPTVSTIGAGDNFNAGFIYGMLKYGITRHDIDQGLSEQQWDNIIGCALEFSAEACKSLYNYVSKEFGERLQREGK